MNESMVTGRMGAEKKALGGRILQKSGLSASQAINLLYDRIIRESNAEFLLEEGPRDDAAWENAARFVDSLSVEQATRFEDMTKAQIRADRLKTRGLM